MITKLLLEESPPPIPHTLEDKTYHFGDIPVTPLDIQHGKLIINGFRFKDCAYITDCSGIPDHTMEKLKGLKLLILNALGFNDHATHFNLNQALEAAETIQAERTILQQQFHKTQRRAQKAWWRGKLFEQFMTVIQHSK